MSNVSNLYDRQGFRRDAPVIGGDYAAHRQARQPVPAGSDGSLYELAFDQAELTGATPEKSGGHQ